MEKNSNNHNLKHTRCTGVCKRPKKQKIGLLNHIGLRLKDTP